ncbi:hypothetical protein K5R88_08825 [Pseudomonas sp. MM213]|uniref:hypothetical protein n=1 Tax=Pseudomonas sp. MM213 TaxID=2866807 RepID=UPI001CF5DC02|nr:hypothetical protein [Pseudomonas sp. MM213]UCP11702.1 hypothetical protein K5R88_08825 [Pseudomonas sp. MM213]
MFRTNESQLQGKFKMSDENLLLWKSVDLSHNQYSFLVEGVGFFDGAFGPNVRLISDTETVQTICSSGDPEFLAVTKVYLISPPWMNRQGERLMEPISEIRLTNPGKEPPIYEFVTVAGQTYTSVPEPSPK